MQSRMRDPFPKCRRYEFGTIIGTDVRWNAAQDEEIRERIDDI
jgi:hypothetical protein